MKTAIILFKSPLAELDAGYISKIANSLLHAGFPTSNLSVLGTNDDLAFRRWLQEYKSTANNLVIVNSNEISFDYKQIIADVVDSALIENENALKFLDAVSNAHGKEYPLSNATMPLEATLIPNVTGAFQGFMLEENGFAMFVLPERIEEFNLACQKYLAPYTEKKLNTKTSRLVFKYFGAKDKLEQTINLAKSMVGGDIEISITCVYGDYKIVAMGETQKANQFAREFLSRLKDEVYAETDATLGERLFDLLRIKNLKLSTAESFTAGRVVNSVISNPGASSFVYEGVVAYTNESKSKRLNIKLEDIIKDGAVSSLTAYRMSAGLLKTGNTDLAISTTGFAGPKTDDKEDKTGLCFIAVGMLDGIHTYKFNFTGDREEITETAKNTALFLAIKKLKSIK